jgi:hypothetical protein
MQFHLASGNPKVVLEPVVGIVASRRYRRERIE